MLHNDVSIGSLLFSHHSKNGISNKSEIYKHKEKFAEFNDSEIDSI
jgi:hypothetical protein